MKMSEAIKTENDICPRCGEELIGGDNSSGVKCSNDSCGYWFCY